MANTTPSFLDHTNEPLNDPNMLVFTIFMEDCRLDCLNECREVEFVVAVYIADDHVSSCVWQHVKLECFDETRPTPRIQSGQTYIVDLASFGDEER